MSCGCGCQMDNCNVVNKQFCEEVPHCYNVHTHVVNNVTRRHYYVPQYTYSEETVFMDEYPTYPMQMNYGYNNANMMFNNPSNINFCTNNSGCNCVNNPTGYNTMNSKCAYSDNNLF